MIDPNRKLKLGMHTYTLHLNGMGESWGNGRGHTYEKAIDLFKAMDLAVEWGLDGLHITLIDVEDKSPEHLAEIKAAAEAHGLYLELNIFLNHPSDPRANATVEDALRIAKAIGADLVKFSIDIERPRPLYGSCMCPEVMRQLEDRRDRFKAALPLMEELGLQIAIENHTETYADEIIWLIREINHPKVGACCDTINSLCVLEGWEACVEKMAPYSNCVHFCDNKIVIDADGTHSYGVALGEGDMDCPKCLQTFKDKAPLDRITLEVEHALGNDPIEVAREKEIEDCVKSIRYMRDVLGVGVRGR